MWEDVPGVVCWYADKNASSASDVGPKWAQAWRDAKLMIASWTLCCSNGRRWGELLRSSLRWQGGCKAFDEVLFWGFGWVKAVVLASGVLRISPSAALTRGTGDCSFWGHRLKYSFCCAIFPLLTWVTWSYGRINNLRTHFSTGCQQWWSLHNKQVYTVYLTRNNPRFLYTFLKMHKGI